MSLASIIRKIDEEAAEQSREIVEEARTEGEQIISVARLKAEEEAAQLLRHSEEELSTVQTKQMATAVLHMRKEKLDNQQQILDKVFAEVVERVKNFDDEQRRKIFKNILLSVSEEHKGNLLLSKHDKSVVNRVFIDEVNAELEKQGRQLRFGLSTKTAPVEQGFLIDFKDFDINYSVEMLLSSLWEEMKGEVSTRLFEAN